MDKFQKELVLNFKVVKLIGEINQSAVEHIEEALRFAADHKINQLTLEIASGGGKVLAEGKIFDLISNFAGRITGLVSPYAFSAAANILQACHSRQALANSLLLYHHTRGMNFTAANLQHAITQIKRWTRNFNRITLRRSTISANEFEKLNNLDLPITPSQALRFGLIDKILPSPNHHYPCPPKKVDFKKFELKEINRYGVTALLGFLDDMREQKYPPLKIFVNPSEIVPGFILPIYELLKSYPQFIHIIGVKDLMNQSVILLLAGDERQMFYNTKFEIDLPEISWEWVLEPQFSSELGQALIREQLSEFTRFIQHEFLTRTKLTRATYLKLLSQDGYFDAQTALKYGIIHSISMPTWLVRKK